MSVMGWLRGLWGLRGSFDMRRLVFGDDEPDEHFLARSHTLAFEVQEGYKSGVPVVMCLVCREELRSRCGGPVFPVVPPCLVLWERNQ